jgi:hypothetical protein
MRDGITPWPEILRQLGPQVTGTLEFVPVAICKMEEFDLGKALDEAKSEIAYIQEIWK